MYFLLIGRFCNRLPTSHAKQLLMCYAFSEAFNERSSSKKAGNPPCSKRSQMRLSSLARLVCCDSSGSRLHAFPSEPPLNFPVNLLCLFEFGVWYGCDSSRACRIVTSPRTRSTSRPIFMDHGGGKDIVRLSLHVTAYHHPF